MLETHAQVLLVDDLVTNLDVLEGMLAGMALTCSRAHSGEQAVKLVEEHEPALILLDVQMPGLGGLEAAHEIRALKGRQHVPIIFVTAHASAATQFAGYETGAVDYLIKPLDVTQVRAKVRAFLELYNLRRTVESQARRLAVINEELSAELANLQQSIEGYGDSPAHVDEAGAAAAYEEDYRSLLWAYMEAQGMGQKPPHEKASEFAERLGNASLGPRTLVEIYLSLSRHFVANLPLPKARQLRDQCRALTLEIMGHLAEFYRRGRGGKSGRSEGLRKGDQ